MFALVLVCATALVLRAQQSTDDVPTFRTGVEAVAFEVFVTDAAGKPVTDLTVDEFELLEDGKAQPITLFDNTPQPIRLIVMLDVSGSMEGNLSLLRAASEQLFARLGPNDVARVP